MFEGEDGLESAEKEKAEAEGLVYDDSGSFLKASVWARISTVFAGPFFNFILAFLIAIVLVSLNPTDVPVLKDVAPDGAAMQAGFMAGDEILSIDGEKTYLFRDVQLMLALSNGEPMEVVVERAGEKVKLSVTPLLNEETGTYQLGVYGGVYEQSKGLSVLKDAWYEMRYCFQSDV